MYADYLSLKKAESFFKGKIDKIHINTTYEMYIKIGLFQDNIIHKRLLLRYKKDFDKINNYMKQLKSLPKKFNEWVIETALFFSRYIIYDYESNKRYFNSYCTHCGSDLILDTKK